VLGVPNPRFSDHAAHVGQIQFRPVKGHLQRSVLVTHAIDRSKSP
jgi:hypothetical protein